MTLRTKRRLLWGLNALFALVLVGAGGGLVLAPLDEPAPPVSPRPDPVTQKPAEPPEPPPLSAYAAAWQRDLQRPLYDPVPPVVIRKPPPPPKPPPLALQGTIVEPGFAFAVLVTKDGRQRTVRVGQEVDGAELVRVTSDAAVVRFDGREHTLQAPKRGEGR